ncbi:hypothetical protein [Novosphingobium sp.]|uniref:hypothetical protein n=1 Tax=Novosphingobium sp. TaxID=1874826 RepID=UPI002737772A|nr:hypothetical protein [Novosphingobium sp.]MDP3907305.1 hypothetical protein [Novosphingobium sp.]
MTGLLMIVLFTATLLVVAGAMRATWRDHGQHALAIHAQRGDAAVPHEVRWTIRAVGTPSRINVLDFPVRQPARSVPQPQPAAA